VFGDITAKGTSMMLDEQSMVPEVAIPDADDGEKSYTSENTLSRQTTPKSSTEKEDRNESCDIEVRLSIVLPAIH